MKQWYINRIRQRLGAHFRANCQRIEPDRMRLGEMRYNFQCHLNAAHCATVDPRLQVVLCYCVSSEGGAFLHVINRDRQGHYIDNTLGYDYADHDYYFVKVVSKSSYPRIVQWFDGIRRDFIGLHGRVWLCRLLNIQPVDVF